MMELEQYVDIYASEDAIRLRGHAIGLETLIKMYRQGFAVEDMRQELPVLSIEEIFGALTYYLHNKAELDAYVARVEQQRPSVVSRPISPDEKIRAVIREHEHEWIDA